MSQPDEGGIVEPDIKLLPAFWGHKYGQEVWSGIVEYQFRDPTCEVIQTTPNVKNPAAIKMYENSGAAREGEDVYTFPDAMREYTKLVHHYIYRLHRETWQSSKLSNFARDYLDVSRQSID